MDLSDEIVIHYSEDNHEILEISGDNNAKALTVVEVYGSPNSSQSHVHDDLDDLGRLGSPNICMMMAGMIVTMVIDMNQKLMSRNLIKIQIMKLKLQSQPSAILRY